MPIFPFDKASDLTREAKLPLRFRVGGPNEDRDGDPTSAWRHLSEYRKTIKTKRQEPSEIQKEPRAAREASLISR